MNKLVFAALLLGGLAQATGCIIVSDDEGGYLAVSWNLTEGPNDTTASTCPGDTVEVVSERVGGNQYSDLFDCVDGFGVTNVLPLGSYNVWVNVTQGSTLMAQSFLGTTGIDIDGEEVPIGFDIAIDGGYFGLTWSLTDDTRDLTCDEVGAGGVSVLSTLVGPDTGIDDIYDCSDLGATIDHKFDLGNYSIVVSLLDSVDDSVLAASQPRETSLDYGNELNDLGNFEFVFAPN